MVLETERQALGVGLALTRHYSGLPDIDDDPPLDLVRYRGRASRLTQSPSSTRPPAYRDRSSILC
jgi:hypothetical protein